MKLKRSKINELAVNFHKTEIGIYPGAKFRYFLAKNKRLLKAEYESNQEAIKLSDEQNEWIKANGGKEKSVSLEQMTAMAPTDPIAAGILAKEKEAKLFLAEEVEIPLITIAEAEVPADIKASHYDSMFDLIA
jgi:hypothetical protein